MKRLKSNKGYSLVELIIVIAIILIVAAMSLATVTMIQSAKCKDAAVKVDSEIAEIIAASRGMAYDASDPNKFYALYLYKDDSSNNYYIQRGYALRNASTGLYSFTSNGNNLNDDKGINLSSYGVIEWDVTDNDNYTGVVIVYSKSGQCLAGYGTYTFKKKNGNVVATNFVRQNGTHASK
jgi:prepilin-type N-terminal cleavage/methylation domain-containing protein